MTGLAPSTGGSAFVQLGPDVIGAPQFDRRCIVEIGAEPAAGDLSVPRGWKPTLVVNERENCERVKGKILKPWAQPLAISEIVIYNLSQDSRSLIEGKTRIPVRVQAGYGSSLRLVGTISGTQCSSEYQQSGDVVTKIEGTLGSHRLLQHVDQQLGIGTPYSEHVLAMASQLGSVGAATRKLIVSAAAGRIYTDGYSAFGQLVDLFTTALDDMGLEWTVVDDEVIVSRRNETTADTFIVSPESGLIGSPVPDSPPAPGKLRFLRVKCLLNPTFRPGAKVLLRSAIHEGVYRCWDVSHEFDTHVGEWYSSLQLRATKGAR